MPAKIPNMLEDGIQEALEGELALWQERRKTLIEKIDAKISALKTILSPADELGIFSGQPASGQAAIPGLRVASNGSNKGLRETILDIVGQSHRGIDTTAVTKEVVRLGHTASGKTPLNVLVNTELWRLKRKDRIRKQSKKYYPKNE